jgi:uncharacterized protein (DUF1501 family)
MKMKRRDFINTSTAAAAGVIAAPYIAKSKPILNFKPIDRILSDDNDNVLIVIELFGGNDGLNTIVPIAEEDKYRELRDTLHIPAEATVRFEQSDLYMNRALVDDVHNGGMLQLMAEGRLAVVQGIGYDNPTLSHFRSRDIWHAGIINTDPNVKLLDGWIGRYFAELLPDYPEVIPEHPLAIHVGGTIPLAFKSNKGHMGIAITDPEAFFKLGEGLTPTDPKFDNPGDDYFKREYNFAHIIGEQAEEYSKAVKAAYDIGKEKLKVDYGEGLAQKFKLISALIAGGLKSKVYHVNLSNFDSHAQQMDAGYTGAHATLLNELANAVSQFLDDAVQQGYHQRVAGMTVSEFGRRAKDNGSRGTDHGSASIQFVFAGHDENINGGFFNNDGQLVFAKLNAADNIDYTYDFRRTYADALELWLNGTEEHSETVFGEKVPKLEVLRKRISSVEDNLTYENGKFINIYPNPSFGTGSINFTLKKPLNVTVEIYEVTGKMISVLHKGLLMNGNYNFDFIINKSGNYFVNIKTKDKNYSEKIIVLR